MDDGTEDAGDTDGTGDTGGAKRNLPAPRQGSRAARAKGLKGSERPAGFAIGTAAIGVIAIVLGISGVVGHHAQTEREIP